VVVGLVVKVVLGLVVAAWVGTVGVSGACELAVVACVGEVDVAWL
jgi:hypothetical protein